MVCGGKVRKVRVKRMGRGLLCMDSFVARGVMSVRKDSCGGRVWGAGGGG